MRTIRDVAKKNLRWTQPEPLRHAFTLILEDGEIVASVDWQKIDGQTANAESGDGAWTIKRTGNFIQPKVTVRALNSPTDILVFTPFWPGTGYGTVNFTAGNTYIWDKWGLNKLLSSETACANASGQKNYINFIPDVNPLPLSVNVRIAQASDTIPNTELAIMTLLGIYLLVPIDD